MLRYTARARLWPLALTLAAVTALSACTDQLDPIVPDGPPAADGGGAGRQNLGSVLGDQAHWADGYVEAHDENLASYTPGPTYSFNRAGGAITMTKPAGTTGRYVATFSGLSAYLGGRSTVHVTGFLGLDTYCKPVSAYLASDRVEVRCFKASTGLPANANFTLLVTRNYFDLAFAYAHQETGTNYSPSSQGSWNPAGSSTVVRSGVGQYRVSFNNLGTRLRPGVLGHVQVNAVGTSNAYCNASNWYTNGTPNLSVDVRCYATPTGAPVDRRFTVLFLQPAEHLAYAWADKPSLASYSPLAFYSSNPAGGAISITRTGVGAYAVEWPGVDPAIIDEGNVQVTAYGGNTLCKTVGTAATSASVRCYAPNGTPADSRYSVLLGS